MYEAVSPTIEDVAGKGQALYELHIKGEPDDWYDVVKADGEREACKKLYAHLPADSDWDEQEVQRQMRCVDHIDQE